MADKAYKKQEQIKETFQELFVERLNRNSKDEDIWQYADQPLTGAPFFFSETGMVYLLFEIEKQFEIRVMEEELLEYGFSTINQIIRIVQKHFTKD